MHPSPDKNVRKSSGRGKEIARRQYCSAPMSSDAHRESSARLRPAGERDVPALLRMMEDFNRLEGIPWQRERVEPALRRLVGDPSLGAVVVIEAISDERAACGYAVLTYGYDLEFGGRDGYLTEMYVTTEHRGQGIGSAALQRVVELARERGVRALHLTVYPDNAPAVAAYRRAGFRESPRLFMTRVLQPDGAE